MVKGFDDEVSTEYFEIWIPMILIKTSDFSTFLERQKGLDPIEKALKGGFTALFEEQKLFQEQQKLFQEQQKLILIFSQNDN